MKKVRHIRSGRKLTKTEEYIKNTQSKKIGLFLPTVSQYRKLSNVERRLVRRAINKLKDVHHPVNQAEGFNRLRKMYENSMYPMGNKWREVRQSRAVGNLKTMNAYDKENFKAAEKSGGTYTTRLSRKLQLKYGAYDKNADDRVVRDFVRYMEEPKHVLNIKPDVLAQHMSDFNYYETNGIYIITYADLPSKNDPSKHERAAIEDSAAEALRWIAEHDALREATAF